jgi:MFS family permease
MDLHAAETGVESVHGIQGVRGARPAREPGPALGGQRDAAGLTARQVAGIVGVLALAVFMSSLDLFIVNLAFPYIGREYNGTGLGSLSWVLNAYTIVFAAVLVPAGRWADRVGRRRVFTAGLIGFSLGSALCGLSPGVPELIAARVIQAAGAGLMVPASLSLLLASVPASGRAKAIGTWSALGALGPRSGR